MREDILRFISSELNKNISTSEVLVKNIMKEINSIFEYVKEVRQ